MYTWDKEIFSIYFAWENLLLHFTSQFLTFPIQPDVGKNILSMPTSACMLKSIFHFMLQSKLYIKKKPFQR